MAARKYHDSHPQAGRAWRATVVMAAIAGMFLTAVVGNARADQMCVDALCVPFGPAWQRGLPQEEEAGDSHILTQAGTGSPDTAVQLFLPRQSTRLKTDADRFQAQLRRKWRAQYGDQAQIGPRSLAGREWLVCRRPGLEGDDTVFQWVTLWEDRAYSLVWMVPGHQATLPGTALALMEALTWRTAGEAVEEKAAEAGPEHPPAEPLAERPGESTTAPAEAAPAAPPIPALAEAADARAPVAAASADPAWRQVATLLVQPDPDTLAKRVEQEARALGDAGVLTGHALQLAAGSLDWFLEGFQWVPRPVGKGHMKVYFRHGSQVAWSPPPQTLPPAGESGLALDIRPWAWEGENRGGQRVAFRWWSVCGPQAQLDRVRQALARGDVARAERLARPGARRHPACGALATGGSGEAWQRVVDAATLDQPVAQTLALPARPPAPPLPRGMGRQWLLEVRFAASQDGLAPGDRLLAPLAVYYLYEPIGAASPGPDARTGSASGQPRRPG